MDYRKEMEIRGIIINLLKVYLSFLEAFEIRENEIDDIIEMFMSDSYYKFGWVTKLPNFTIDDTFKSILYRQLFGWGWGTGIYGLDSRFEYTEEEKKYIPWLNR